jgi:predicted NBD/HSP70 family sugar kinase
MNNSTPLGNRVLIRAINRSIILNNIKTYGPIDRAQVARVTGLSPATVTGITSELIEAGLVFEKAPGDSRGGRPPILLAINPKGGYVIGIKLMEDHALGALTDLEATVIKKDLVTLHDQSVTSVILMLTHLIERLLSNAGISKKKLIGVGIGLAGIVDFERGLLRQSPFFGWRDLPIRELLQPHVKVPIFLDNDVNTLSMAEQWFGAGQGIDDFLTLTIGRGIGLGIVANGRFYRGTGGGAGEFGHTLIDPEGPKCDCGKQGCLETYVGYPGLVRSSQRMDKNIMNIDDLFKGIEESDANILAVLQNSGDLLGRCVSNLINLLNPKLIIVGGEGVRLGKYFFEPMQTAIQKYSVPEMFRDCQIRIEPWGDDAWARGAASLVLRQLFENPIHQGEFEFFKNS